MLSSATGPLKSEVPILIADQSLIAFFKVHLHIDAIIAQYSPISSK